MNTLLIVILIICILFLFSYQFNAIRWRIYLHNLKHFTNNDSLKEIYDNSDTIINIIKSTSFIQYMGIYYYNNFYKVYLTPNIIVINNKYWRPNSPEELAKVYDSIAILNRITESYIVPYHKIKKQNSLFDYSYFITTIFKILNLMTENNKTPAVNYTFSDNTSITYNKNTKLFKFNINREDKVINDIMIPIFIYILNNLIETNNININNIQGRKLIFDNYVILHDELVKTASSLDTYKSMKSFNNLPIATYMSTISKDDGYEYIINYMANIFELSDE